MTDQVVCRHGGRDFTVADMALLNSLIEGPPSLTRAALAREFCRRVRWFKADGGLKDMSAKIAMLAMHRKGIITLPPPTRAFRKLRPVVFGPETDPPTEPTPTTLDDVQPLDFSIVTGGTPQSALWNQFIARYHYLGYTPLVGTQMRYAIHDRHGRLLALLAFSSAAWKLAPRDAVIGWTHDQRQKNLHLLVDNPRFLILPWIHIPNLGSHILAIARRQLPQDWSRCHAITPVLIETFVQTPRYTGAVYRASGWIHVGTTKGRGRNDRYTRADLPRKDIWLRPLRKDWKRFLNQ